MPPQKYNLERSDLVNPCKYSFRDLIDAAGMEVNIEKLYKISQKDRNNEVKKLCRKAGWYFCDTIYSGEIYTSFSPEVKNNLL